MLEALRVQQSRERCSPFRWASLCLHLPLFRRAIEHNTNIAVMVSHCTVATLVSASLSYYFLMEPPSVPIQRGRLIPQLGPLSALVPGMGALATCHLLYPGIFILMCEPTLKQKLREYARMTYKVTFAFLPSHFVYVGLISVVLGCSCCVVRRLWSGHWRPCR